MNANIPTMRVLVSDKFLKGKGGDFEKDSHFTEGYAFAIASVKGRALAFHVMLKTGAHFTRIPLHALQAYDRSDWMKMHSLQCLQLWDCFSFKPLVTVYDYLIEHECIAVLRSGIREDAYYRFTVDWLPDRMETPGLIMEPDQSKCAHVVELENGQYAALPTNRVLWKDAYFIGNNPSADKAGYVTDEVKWHSETSLRWDVSKDKNAMYGTTSRSRPRSKR